MSSQFIAATSTIADGNMTFRYGEPAEVLENRRRFIIETGLPPERCVVMDSPHQAIITVINDSDNQTQFGLSKSVLADTLITQLPNTPLVLTTADCLPITLYDPITHTIALMHLSRHTFCLSLIEKSLQALQQTYDVASANLRVVIGPHIHATSYCFPLPLNKEDPKLLSYMIRNETTVCIDLAGAAVATLTKLGVAEEQIEISPIDTFADQHYFSHVRTTQTGEAPGRLATIACLSPKTS